MPHDTFTCWNNELTVAHHIALTHLNEPTILKHAMDK